MYKKLKLKMFEKNISQNEIAQLLGIHRNTLEMKLKGKTKFFVDELLKIRDTYFPELPLDELCG